jgi:hypothetical protein
MAANILGGEKTYTVAGLPVSNPPAFTVKLGDRAFVTDATTPAFNAAAVGGGAVFVPVFWNGTAWVVG